MRDRIYRIDALGFALFFLAGSALCAAEPERFTFEVVAGQEGTRGSKDGAAGEALLNMPVGIARDGAGNIYVGEWYSAVRRIAPDGTVTTIAGKSGENGFADGAGGEARFHTVANLVVDSAGNIFATDFYNHAIRKITPEGNVSTLAGGSFGYADGIGADAQFIWPEGIALDGTGNLVVTDHYAENIRRITAAGAVSTIAGKVSGGIEGGVKGDVDGTGTAARFWAPSSVVVDKAGNIYVADMDNATIRKATPDGIVTTFAGSTKVHGSKDGPALEALFDHPQALTLDSNGNLYVIEQSTGNLRKISANGIVSTVQMYRTNGESFRFSSAEGITVDEAGNLYVADGGKNVIFKGSPALALGIEKEGQADAFTLSFRAAKAGCVVESADSLAGPWSALESRSTADGSTVTIQESSAGGKQRFYRIREE